MSTCVISRLLIRNLNRDYILMIFTCMYIPIQQFLKQNLISSHRPKSSLQLPSPVRPFCFRDPRQWHERDKEGLKKRGRETENRGRDEERPSRTATSGKRQRIPRDYRLPSPVGRVDTPGTPRPLPSKATLFLLTSSSPLSTSIRVLNTRRKRKTARRPRHWLRSLYFVSTRTSHVYTRYLQVAHFFRYINSLINLE